MSPLWIVITIIVTDRLYTICHNVTLHLFAIERHITLFFPKIFLCGPFLKSLLNFLQDWCSFMFWFFGPQSYGILALRPGIEPAPFGSMEPKS